MREAAARRADATTARTTPAILPTPEAREAPAPLPPVPLDPVLRDVADHAPEWPAIGTGILGTEAWEQLKQKVRADLPPAQRADFDAKAASMSPETKQVLGVIHERSEQRSAQAAQAILWIAVFVVAVALVVTLILAWREEAAARADASTPTAPTTRPPYNPDKHGSLEQYRAAFAHLPGPLDARHDAARVGSRAQPWEPSP